MKHFIVGWAIVLLCLNAMIYRQDSHMFQRQLIKLKFVCEEAAAAGAQYYVKTEYKNGYFVFNKEEGTKAAEYIIKTQLKLNNELMPLVDSYWRDKVTYTITFYDDSNIVYPYLYTHSSGALAHVVTSPTVIVSINAGKARYRQMISPPTAIRVAAHAWKGR